MTNYRDQWRRKAMAETPAINPRDYYTEEEIARVLELQAQRDTDKK